MLGIIGGTSFLGSKILDEGQNIKIATNYEEVELVKTREIVFLPRHGMHTYLPPHRINHQANIEALYNAGVNKIISFGSVGSLSEHIKPGSLLIPDDYFAPFRVVTFQTEILNYVIPGYDVSWRRVVIEELKNKDLEVVDGGVYAETLGPRFETPAEIRYLSQFADVVGMTCAAEATLAKELGIVFTNICMIDNYANGIGAEQLSGQKFREQVNLNKSIVNKTLEVVAELKGYFPDKK